MKIVNKDSYHTPKHVPVIKPSTHQQLYKHYRYVTCTRLLIFYSSPGCKLHAPRLLNRTKLMRYSNGDRDTKMYENYRS
ncbi:hypothetical protein B5X24_HaOG213693 [Helicoverpa armigera]|nr:hypothetical protein B5X24_HaOG213693 [Helicoverpa armigera]